MNKMNFGQLIEKLLYLSDQKKTNLAKQLGYDTSYISKWTNSKGLPTNKNINGICRVVAEFIVTSLNEVTKQELINYFEISIEKSEDDKEFLIMYIERILKESYLHTTHKKANGHIKETYNQQLGNSMCYVSPKFRKKHLVQEVLEGISKDEELDMIISMDVFSLPSDEEKITLSTIKKDIINVFELSSKKGTMDSVLYPKIKVRFISGFKPENKEIDEFLFSSQIIFNMISEYPEIEFEIYNCDVVNNMGLFIIKDKLSYSTVYKKDGESLVTTISKDKNVINEFYCSLEETLKSQGNIIYTNKDIEKIILDNTYMEYIMGYELKWLMGEFNEFFMPEDLFIEIAETIFKDKLEILDELKRIWKFLNNVVYKDDLKVIINDSVIRKYTSSGEITFFNHTVTLTFEQRSRHIKNLHKILEESNSIQLKIIDGKILNKLDIISSTNLLLSKDLSLIKIDPTQELNQYAIITDNDFMKICNEFFDVLWNERQDITCSDKDYISTRISKALQYVNIICNEIDES